MSERTAEANRALKRWFGEVAHRCSAADPYQLPEGGGKELLQFLKQIELQKETVLLSASLLESRAKKGLETKDLMMAPSLVQALENSDQAALLST